MIEKNHLEITNILVKSFQFKFLVKTEKNIFCLYTFFAIKHFKFYFTFYVKPQPPEKTQSLFPTNPPLKSDILSSPLPPF